MEIGGQVSGVISDGGCGKQRVMSGEEEQKKKSVVWTQKAELKKSSSRYHGGVRDGEFSE